MKNALSDLTLLTRELSSAVTFEGSDILVASLGAFRTLDDRKTTKRSARVAPQ
jgi:hypothetical protein